VRRRNLKKQATCTSRAKRKSAEVLSIAPSVTRRGVTPLGTTIELDHVWPHEGVKKRVAMGPTRSNESTAITPEWQENVEEDVGGKNVYERNRKGGRQRFWGSFWGVKTERPTARSAPKQRCHQNQRERRGGSTRKRR